MNKWTNERNRGHVECGPTEHNGNGNDYYVLDTGAQN